MALPPKLREKLPEFKMEHLSELDRGSVGRRVDDAVRMCLDNISKFPHRDGGKPEVRRVDIAVFLTPELKETTVPVETGGGRVQDVKHMELVGVSVRVKVKSSLPDAESADVKMACEVRNGVIKEVRFNPHNNTTPEQLELDLDDEDA